MKDEENEEQIYISNTHFDIISIMEMNVITANRKQAVTNNVHVFIFHIMPIIVCIFCTY